MKRNLLLLIFLSLTTGIVLSQSYTFTTYSIADGLAQTQVKCITEDQNGYLWLGTVGGLSCFNGSDFKNYSTDDGLLTNGVTSLFAEKDKLWIGHEDGISLYYKRKFKNWAFSKKKKQVNVSSILSYKGNLVITTNGDGIYLLKNNKLNHILLQDEDKNRIRNVELFEDKLYFATRGGLLVSTDLIRFDVLDVGEDINLSGLCTQNDELIFASIDGKVYRYHPASMQVRLIYDYHMPVFTKACFTDNKRTLFLANSEGLSMINSENHFQLIDQSRGLPLDALNCVFQDKNGTYWIGSDGKGLFRFAGTQLKYYNKNNGFQSDLITSVKQVKNKEFCFGTYDVGLIYKHENILEPLPLPNNTIWATIEDHLNNEWIGSSNGLFKVNEERGIHRLSESFARNEKITCFFKEKNRQILVGGSFGIWKIENGELTNITTNFDPYEIGTVRSITVYKQRIICSADGGVFEFKNGRFIPIFNLKKRVYCLRIDQENNLWIGSEDGFYWSDGTKLKQLRLSDQPASNFINFINSNKTELFVGTNNGLFVLSNLTLHEKSSIKHYGIEEGLINLETNINSSYFDNEGNFWFGTAEGLMEFDLAESDQNKFEGIPHLNVSAIKINFQEIDYQKYATTFDAFGLPSAMVLGPTKNNIIVELDGVILKNFDHLRYEYWLEGLDEGWSPSFRSPLVTLSNLPSGDYTLHIRAKNDNGKTSKEYRLQLSIKPFFYKTWWFILICLFALALSIYGYFKYRINRERQKSYQESLEFKTKLLTLEQQSLNASMNRHFIFNSLNSIQYFINTQDKLSANKYLTNFAKLIRKNLDSSSENNNQISLSQEIERLELYLSLESMRFKDRFDYQILTNNIDLESITVPSMLFQPFVENSIIHGILPITDKKGLITIKLRIEENNLIVELEDNGVGIEKSMTKKGLINGDHRSQGMEITAKRISLLNKINHQSYQLEGPFQLEDENRSINGTRVLLKIPLENLED